ncbi:MAG: tetratricopeptide repeat protein [Bacteroidales bacterium]|nr:tetratricopeptide repeat protein [Bacteroidales bacterium]MCF8337497.1 tetratricopeptide repeat protein [Bacteroidales bacterium]
MNNVGLLLVAFSLIGHLSGQTVDSYDQKITEAYVQDQMADWRSTLTSIETHYKRQPGNSLLRYLTISQYGYIGYLLEIEAEDKAEKLLEKAEKNSNNLKKKGFCSEAYTIKAGLTGYRIGLRPYKGPFLGKNNKQYISEALQCDSLNPMAWLEKGNTYYHMPGMFGGSYEKASRYYQKAVALFEQRQESYPRWLYLNTLVWQGKALEAKGKTSKARQAYQKALEVAPGFKWVKEELLPGLVE